MIKVLQYFSKTRLNPAIIAFVGGTVSSSIHRDLWRGLVWLFLVVAAVAVMAALATGVSQAHDANFCEGNGDYDHYIEDVNNGPPGRYLLWMSTKHDVHDGLDSLFVRAGDGVSTVSLVKHDSRTFNYLGRDITLNDADLYKAYYTVYQTTPQKAVLEVCFAVEMGFWHPIALDGNNPPVDSNSPPRTINLPIPRQDVEITGDPKTIDLSRYFADDDNDELTYAFTAVSSDENDMANVATVSVAGSTLTISPPDSEETGVTMVTVTASAVGGSASMSFTVVVYKQPPLRANSQQMSGIVDPYKETPVESKDGSLTVTFPVGSMSEYYQARIDPDSDECGSEPPSGNEYLCLSVDLFDLAANAIHDPLIKKAKMVLTLNPAQPPLSLPKHSLCIRATGHPGLGLRYRSAWTRSEHPNVIPLRLTAMAAPLKSSTLALLVNLLQVYLHRNRKQSSLRRPRHPLRQRQAAAVVVAAAGVSVPRRINARDWTSMMTVCGIRRTERGRSRHLKVATPTMMTWNGTWTVWIARLLRYPIEVCSASRLLRTLKILRTATRTIDTRSG